MTFQDALRRRGLRFRLAGDKLHLNCLFCASRGKPADTKQRLCIHLKHGWAKCVHCEWKHRYGMRPILRALGVESQVTTIDSPTSDQAIPSAVELPEDFQLLTHVYDERDAIARKYILSRGITEQQIKANRIGVSYIGRYAYRIVFPVYRNHDLVGINARDFTGRRKPKYLLNKGDKSLYHFDPEAETIILSEGVIKALRISRVTKANSASLLGHDLTDIQLEQIKQSRCKQILLYPDLDRVGKQGFIKVADKLCQQWHGRISFVWPIPGPADDIPLDVLHRVVADNRIVFDGINRL